MELQQLQLLAGRARDLLQQSNLTIGHNQSLDLIAALPGLRNWPEVRAFPDRVAACELDESAASRLAFRLRKKFGLELSAPDVLVALNGASTSRRTPVPDIWPAGPAPGVYVTTSQAAIEAIVAKYEEASDGAVFFAERAANGVDGAIDLGEYGLWSSGLDRMPSGTLIVVGPMELVEDEWDRSVERLQMACTLAELSGHRVVIIAETPTPEDLCEDMWLMARTGEHEGVNYSLAMRGVITHEGDLALRVPFAKPWPRIESPRSIATPDAIPTEARELITKALQGRKSGLLIFGGDAVREHWAADLVDAGLALTEHAGPAARIMPRTRGTPAKNFWVPEATRQLPYLPSIESAYDRGFRRMLIDPHATDGETLRKYAGKAIFIAGTHGYEARGIVLSGIRGVSFDKEMEMHSHIIGLLGVARLPSRNGIRAICDLFIGAGESPPGLERGAELYDFVSQNRVLKWEDQVEQLLGRGELAMADLKDMQIQPPTLARFAQQIGKHFAGPSTTQ